MDAQQLFRMANQIGAFFEAMPDRAEAQVGTVRHLRSFWEPRMRREFLACVDAGTPAVAAAHGGFHREGEEPRPPVELSPFVREAIAAHRALLD